MIATDAKSPARSKRRDCQKRRRRDRRNFAVREAVRMQGKIARTHLLIRHAGTREDLHRQACEYAVPKTGRQYILDGHKARRQGTTTVIELRSGEKRPGIGSVIRLHCASML